MGNFDELFPQGQGPAQAPPVQGGPAPAQGPMPTQGRGIPPSAEAIIRKFVEFAKSQAEPMSLEEIVEMIMSAIVAAGYQIPEEKVTELITKYYNETPEGAQPPEGGGMPQGGPPISGGQPLA